MAKRRMFSLDIVDTDLFLDLPLTTQALYFHLGMRADDDGFVSSPKRILATVGGSADDMRLLAAKGYVIPFESGVCAIRDWKVNNHIQKDRYHETLYKVEKRSLQQSETGAYFLADTSCIQNGSILDTEVRLGEVRLVKEREDKASLAEARKQDRGTGEGETEEQRFDRMKQEAIAMLASC